MISEIDSTDELDCALSYGTKVEEITLLNGTGLQFLVTKESCITLG